jgi:hypothetical protein
MILRTKVIISLGIALGCSLALYLGLVAVNWYKAISSFIEALYS